jgi:hypothetical protein
MRLKIAASANETAPESKRNVAVPTIAHDQALMSIYGSVYDSLALLRCGGPQAASVAFSLIIV